MKVVSISIYRSPILIYEIVHEDKKLILEESLATIRADLHEYNLGVDGG